MKILKVLNWVFRITVFLLILVLVLDNMQTIDFNLFSMYHLRLPLIVLVLIFFVLGILLGLVFGLMKRFSSNSHLRKLELEVMQLKEGSQNKII